MHIFHHSTKIRLLRFLSAVLYPIKIIQTNGEIIVLWITGFIATWLSLAQFSDLNNWFPVEKVRIGIMLILSLLLAIFSSLPAFNQKKSINRLQAQFRTHYAAYIIRSIDHKLDSMVKSLQTDYSTGSLTASIMVPIGNEVLSSARRLKMISASKSLRNLPSMALTLDWDEGVAGRIWKEGSMAAAIAVDNNPTAFENFKINPIKKQKRRDGSYGHKSGVCLPINFQDSDRGTVQLLGVLSIGSAKEEDVAVFQGRDFQIRVFDILKTDIVPDLRVYCLANNTLGEAALFS